MCYTLSLATAGNTTTNGAANTENETMFAKPGVRNIWVGALSFIGKGAGLTAISGIVHRLIRFATASTAGTAITPQPKDPGMQAAKMTAASAPTAGLTRTNHLIVGCGAASPGGWTARDIDAMYALEGGSALSYDLLNASGTVSLAFEWSAEVYE